MKKPELLAPAGNFEKMEYAIAYGADAVYFAGESFGMRALADNFSKDQLKDAIGYIHSHGKKAYITLNITARNDQIGPMTDMAMTLDAMGADALIISDIGLISALRSRLAYSRIHVSTQANVTNFESALLYHSLGAKRIILARELSLDEIAKIRKETPKELELEVFVHGAMCISYSGRCLLSSFMTGRDSNQGNCAQACRWKYSLVEEKRPGEYFPVYEDDNGSYIMNSKDLCLVEKIGSLVKAGVDSFKIEGRMKSAFYVATTVNVYRQALDLYLKQGFLSGEELAYFMDELDTISHRIYTEGFINGMPDDGAAVNHADGSYIRGYTFCGVIKEYDTKKGMLMIEQRNSFSIGDILEIVSPADTKKCIHVSTMYDAQGNMINRAPHPQMEVLIPYIGERIPAYSFLRRKD